MELRGRSGRDRWSRGGDQGEIDGGRGGVQRRRRHGPHPRDQTQPQRHENPQQPAPALRGRDPHDAAATAGNIDEAASLFAAAKADADAYNKKLGGIMDEATRAHKNAAIRFAFIAEISTSEGGAGDQMMPADVDELEKLLAKDIEIIFMTDSVDELLTDEGFDAVFLGTGAAVARQRRRQPEDLIVLHAQQLALGVRHEDGVLAVDDLLVCMCDFLVVQIIYVSTNVALNHGSLCKIEKCETM